MSVTELTGYIPHERCNQKRKDTSSITHDCYEVTFVKGAEKFSQQLNKSSSFNPDSTWKEL